MHRTPPLHLALGASGIYNWPQEISTNAITNLKDRRVLRVPELTKIVGLSRSTIQRLEAEGAFVRKIQLGPRSVGYFSDEVACWLEQRAITTH